MFAGGELTDCNTCDAVGVFFDCFAVDEGIVLAIVADEDPFHVGVFDKQVAQLDFLVLLT